MLQFWKRSSQKERINSGSSAGSSPPSSPCLVNGDGPISLNNFESGILAHLDDEGLCDIGDAETPPQHSRLSKTLSEVLSDKSALGYFIQYLDTQGGLSYVRCYLDIDSFRSAAEISNHLNTPNIITRDQLEESDTRLLSPLPRGDHDSLSVSTDCDSYTADSTSLCDLSEVDVNYKVNRRKEKLLTDDSLRIFKKYIAQEAPNPILCPEELRNDLIEAICTKDGVIATGCYDKIQKYVYNVLEEKYFNDYLRTHYNCKHQIDILTSGNIILQDILYNEAILFYFMEYLEQENSSVLLEFWLAATNFRQQNSCNSQETQNDAIVLYDKYFSLQALNPLGFSDKIRFLIEQNICHENGPQIDCFYLPIRIIENYLDKSYLKPFLSSQLYFKYLSELISTVQTNSCPNTITKSRPTHSECSSEASNSFPQRKLPIKPPKTDMNIDTRQLYDPDSLWKRRKTRRLSFGRITHLGRFETDVEPEPDKKTESRIARAMKRLVNLEESKTKEEMAWQVAEMIIKDITNVTLAEEQS